MHWMGWQKILIDKAKYVHGLQQMMGMIKLQPVMQGIEIGLGWGISAQTFLETFPAAHLISVDSYRELEAIEKLRELYPDRFACIHPDDELETGKMNVSVNYLEQLAKPLGMTGSGLLRAAEQKTKRSRT